MKRSTQSGVQRHELAEAQRICAPRSHPCRHPSQSSTLTTPSRPCVTASVDRRWRWPVVLSCSELPCNLLICPISISAPQPMPQPMTPTASRFMASVGSLACGAENDSLSASPSFSNHFAINARVTRRPAPALLFFLEKIEALDKDIRYTYSYDGAMILVFGRIILNSSVHYCGVSRVAVDAGGHRRRPSRGGHPCACARCQTQRRCGPPHPRRRTRSRGCPPTRPPTRPGQDNHEDNT